MPCRAVPCRAFPCPALHYPALHCPALHCTALHRRASPCIALRPKSDPTRLFCRRGRSVPLGTRIILDLALQNRRAGSPRDAPQHRYFDVTSIAPTCLARGGSLTVTVRGKNLGCFEKGVCRFWTAGGRGNSYRYGYTYLFIALRLHPFLAPFTGRRTIRRVVAAFIYQRATAAVTSLTLTAAVRYLRCRCQGRPTCCSRRCAPT